MVEAEVREEVIREMEERMADMEDMYTRRLAREVCLSSIDPRQDKQLITF